MINKVKVNPIISKRLIESHFTILTVENQDVMDVEGTMINFQHYFNEGFFTRVVPYLHEQID